MNLIDFLIKLCKTNCEAEDDIYDIKYSKQMIVLNRLCDDNTVIENVSFSSSRKKTVVATVSVGDVGDETLIDRCSKMNVGCEKLSDNKYNLTIDLHAKF